MKKIVESKTLDKRNYGIDFLRIIAMFFVVLLHSLGQGGILSSVTPNSLEYKVFWIIQIIALCAVNIFSIISGYVSYSPKEKKVKYSNYLTIWLEVVFYSVLITLLFNIFTDVTITKKDYYMAIMPVTNDLYWYFTAFTGLYIIKPLLDRGIRSCSVNTMKKVFVSIIICFSFFATIAQSFNLRGGYSFIWIVLMYIIGACIKKCEIGKKLKTKTLIFALLFFYLVTYIYKMYGFEFTFLNIEITKDIFILYISPTILLCSICYVLIFSRLKANGEFKSIIKFITPTYFSIYLLNTHRLIWEHWIKDVFIFISNEKVVVMLCYVFGFSLLFSLLSIVIDKFRIKIFEVLKIKALSSKIEKGLYIFINKLSSII